MCVSGYSKLHHTKIAGDRLLHQTIHNFQLWMLLWNKNSKARFNFSECSLWGLFLLQYISILILWSQHFAFYSLIVSLFRNATTNILPQHRSREKSSLVKISAEIFIRDAYSAFLATIWLWSISTSRRINNWAPVK